MSIFFLRCDSWLSQKVILLFGDVLNKKISFKYILEEMYSGKQKV